MTPQNAIIVIGAAWLAIGLGVAAALQRQGQPPSTAFAAIIAWPALLPVLGALPEPGATGPFTERIGRAFLTLRQSVQEPHVAGITDLIALAAIEASLLRADARIAAVDRLLSDPAVVSDPGAERLRSARTRASAEVETVLAQLVHVRVQLGLVALVGDTSTVRAHLAELAARARALEEVAVC